MSEDPDDLKAGDRFADKYEIESVLGQGGFGKVYRVKNTAGFRFALKILRSELTTHRSARERFLTEMRIAMALHHENAVPVRDADEWNGHLYYTMDFVEGETLDAVLARETRISPDRVLAWSAQILSYLEFLHDQGYAHRDLKLPNIMLEGDSRIRVLDLGVAKALDPGEGAGLTGGFIVGTPEYMAPEQITGDAQDHRIDIYALGAVMYACCSGRLPFERPSRTDLLQTILTRDPAPLPQLVRGLPHEMWMLIERALRKNPGERFATAREFAEAVAEARTRIHRPPDGWEAAETCFDLSPPRRGKKGLWMSLVALVIAAIGIVAWEQGRPGQNAPQDSARGTVATRGAERDKESVQKPPTTPETGETTIDPPAIPRDAPPAIHAEDVGEGDREAGDDTSRGQGNEESPDSNTPLVENPVPTFPPRVELHAPASSLVSQDEIRIELEVSGTPPFAVSVGGDEPLILEKEGRASILHRLPAEDGPHSFPIEVSGQGEPWTGDISLVLDRRPPILDSLDPSPGTYWFPGQGLQVTASADEDLGSGTRIGGVDPDLVGATATAVCSFSSDGKIEIVLADRAGNVAEQRTLELRPVRVPAGMQPDPASGVDEQLGWARAISEPRTGITLVLVPTPPREGFWMGAVPGDDLALDREKPGHRVTLSRPFYLGKTEVSWRQWSTAIAAGKLDRFEAVPDISAISDWSNVTEDLPVLDVSWQQAVAFCSWLGMTLPTEAQWEWACRQEAELTAYPWGSSFDDGQGWANVADASSDFGTRDDRPATFKDGFEHTAPVGSLQPSTAAGFRHLIGNVMEWCRDAEDFDAYRSRVGRLTADPLVTLPGSRRRILKGGSYKHGARSCRISSRSSLAEDDRANFRTIGFRVCLEIDGD